MTGLTHDQRSERRRELLKKAMIEYLADLLDTHAPHEKEHIAAGLEQFAPLTLANMIVERLERRQREEEAERELAKKSAKPQEDRPKSKNRRRKPKNGRRTRHKRKKQKRS